MGSAREQIRKFRRRSVVKEVVVPDTMEGVVEALFDLLMYKAGLHINEAIKLFSILDIPSFEDIVKKFHATGDFDSKQTLIYYLTLFRKEAHVKYLMENAELPLEFVESIVLSIVVRTNLGEPDGDKALDELLDTLSHKTQYELVTQTSFISRDLVLVHYLLAKLDKEHLDRYFKIEKNAERFVIGVCNLPETLVRTFFFRNPELHGFYMMFFDTVDAKLLPKAKEYCEIDLTEVDKIKRLAHDIIVRFSPDAEFKKSLSQRGKERYAYIISRIRYLADVQMAILNLQKEGAIDDHEVSLLREIVFNPFYSDVLERYTQKIDENEIADTVIF